VERIAISFEVNELGELLAGPVEETLPTGRWITGPIDPVVEVITMPQRFPPAFPNRPDVNTIFPR
jgi:hypothetical protein